MVAMLASDDTLATSTNLEIQQNLIRSIAADIVARSGIAKEESIAVRFLPIEDGWIIENAFLKSLQLFGNTVSIGQENHSQSILIEVASAEVNVQYSDMHHDGFLGTKKVKRTLSARLDCKIIEGKSGVVRLSDTFQRSISDTVQVSDIEHLESTGIKSTTGTLPSETFLDRIVEPFIIIGTTGVVVYLLFNIRSS